MRVVLDTNVLVSAFNFPGGPPEEVYRLALEGVIDLVISPPLLAELARVLTEKFDWEAVRVEEAIAEVADTGVVVRPNERVRVVEDDPADDRVLEAALEGAADIIVSGDMHVLRLKSWREIQIMNPSTFLAEFE
ncbi:MAG: putative toxin-antitoxin system toxin component, PIN family [Actinomycetota bacterium]|nr:putative toxin-antitoxin system toxin component, PIN family [Actinomycetota bacterium]